MAFYCRLNPARIRHWIGILSYWEGRVRSAEQDYDLAQHEVSSNCRPGGGFDRSGSGGACIGSVYNATKAHRVLVAARNDLGKQRQRVSKDLGIKVEYRPGACVAARCGTHEHLERNGLVSPQSLKSKGFAGA